MAGWVYRAPTRVPYLWQAPPLRRIPRSAPEPAFDPGDPIPIKAGNPTTLVAPFTENRDAQTEAGLVRFAIVDGHPIVDYQPWGFGEWGEGGAWGEWAPKMLHLRSAIDDAVSLDPTDYLDPYKAAIAFRVVRYQDTGTFEYVLECGEDGVDWLRVYIDDSDLLTLSFASDGALPSVVTSDIAIMPNTLYFFEFEWQHTYMALRVDGSTRVEGSRGVPTGTWGAGLLYLKAA